MKRWCLIVVCALLAGAAFARGPQHKDRTNVILALIRARAERQHDSWFADGDFPRSIQSLRLLHALFPTDYDLETDLGWMLENVEDYADAIKVYIDYRKANPTDPNGPYPEAEFYFREHLYAKVPPLIEPVLRLGTHDPNTYRILAISYERLGLYQDSERIWDAYLAFKKDDGQAKVNRARVEKKRLGLLPAKPPART